MGKAAAVAVGLLIAVQALPALLRPPEPPPLAADVGLPRVVPAPEEPPPPELRFEKRHERAKGPTGSAATDAISSRSRPKHRRKRHRPAKPSPAPSAPAPLEPAPYEPAPAPVPSPAPAPPPAPPSDGSEEFAPR